MKYTSYSASILALALSFFAVASAFSPVTPNAVAFSSKTLVTSQIKMSFNDEPERKSLTRESEPEEFFATNTDKMSDEEKIPIAIAGVLFITVPFVAGLIALYAAK